MTDPVKEQLSACLDGELPEAELDLLLKQVGRDRALRASLGRYALIGETLRSQAAVAAPADFSKRIADAIEAESPLDQGSEAPQEAPVEAPLTVPTERSTPAVRRPAHWLRPAAGFAVAAGVAALAILSLQPTTDSPESPESYVADATTSPAPVAAPGAADASSYIVPASTTGYVPAARLTNYVVAHSEYSTPLGRRSVLSGVLTEEVEETDAADDADSESRSDDDVTQP